MKEINLKYNKTNNNCLKSKKSVHGNKIELNHLAIFQICFLQESHYNNIIQYLKQQGTHL